MAKPNWTSADEIGMQLALAEATKSREQGGIPIGSALVVLDDAEPNGCKILGFGHNERIQKYSPTLHGEISALENAGRLKAEVYRRSTIVSSCIIYSCSCHVDMGAFYPCSMCSGAISLYKIPRVVIGENQNFKGDEDLLRIRGVEIVVLDNPECKRLMQSFISENREDSGLRKLVRYKLRRGFYRRLTTPQTTTATTQPRLKQLTMQVAHHPAHSSLTVYAGSPVGPVKDDLPYLADQFDIGGRPSFHTNLNVLKVKLGQGSSQADVDYFVAFIRARLPNFPWQVVSITTDSTVWSPNVESKVQGCLPPDLIVLVTVFDKVSMIQCTTLKYVHKLFPPLIATFASIPLDKVLHTVAISKVFQLPTLRSLVIHPPQSVSTFHGRKTTILVVQILLESLRCATALERASIPLDLGSDIRQVIEILKTIPEFRTLELTKPITSNMSTLEEQDRIALESALLALESFPGLDALYIERTVVTPLIQLMGERMFLQASISPHPVFARFQISMQVSFQPAPTTETLRFGLPVGPVKDNTSFIQDNTFLEGRPSFDTDSNMLEIKLGRETTDIDVYNLVNFIRSRGFVLPWNVVSITADANIWTTDVESKIQGCLPAHPVTIITRYYKDDNIQETTVHYVHDDFPPLTSSFAIIPADSILRAVQASRIFQLPSLQSLIINPPRSVSEFFERQTDIVQVLLRSLKGVPALRKASITLDFAVDVKQIIEALKLIPSFVVLELSKPTTFAIATLKAPDHIILENALLRALEPFPGLEELVVDQSAVSTMVEEMGLRMFNERLVINDKGLIIFRTPLPLLFQPVHF
ncbi:hypothetical protein CVT26_010940 [Gymnopilus dilepis]|uniref:CMP/dCMP-type deaminase domain-containing protein n=1 Tax=Gymnopilus dilepis TaxID=231916 RepID=A0A409VIX9_9AGAR|nr:hypothetical protein CVT26_010940 [Gymnopilus dilepis]